MSIHGRLRINQSLFDLPKQYKSMKTVSTKLDKQTFEKFQEICNNDGLCTSESLRDLIKMSIEAYEEGFDAERKSVESTSNLSRPEMKNVRISYDDGKTWHDVN